MAVDSMPDRDAPVDVQEDANDAQDPVDYEPSQGAADKGVAHEAAASETPAEPSPAATLGAPYVRRFTRHLGYTLASSPEPSRPAAVVRIGGEDRYVGLRFVPSSLSTYVHERRRWLPTSCTIREVPRPYNDPPAGSADTSGIVWESYDDFLARAEQRDDITDPEQEQAQPEADPEPARAPASEHPRVTCSYQFDWDEHGVIYRIGSRNRQEYWTNPAWDAVHPGDKPPVSVSVVGSCSTDPRRLLDRTGAETTVRFCSGRLRGDYSRPVHSAIRIDLGERREVKPFGYTVRAGESCCLTDWMLRGSFDNTSWLVLDDSSHSFEEPIPPPPPVVLTAPMGMELTSLRATLMEADPTKVEICAVHSTSGSLEPNLIRVNRDVMDQMTENDEFIVKPRFVNGELYGFARCSVEAIQAEGKVCLLVLDMKDAVAIQQSGTLEDAKFVFVAPSSIAQLEEQIRLTESATAGPGEEEELAEPAAEGELSAETIAAPNEEAVAAQVEEEQVELCEEELAAKLIQDAWDDEGVEEPSPDEPAAESLVVEYEEEEQLDLDGKLERAKQEMERESSGKWDLVIATHGDNMESASQELVQFVLPPGLPRIPVHPPEFTLAPGTSGSFDLMPCPRVYRYFEICARGDLTLAGFELYGDFFQGSAGL